MAIYNCPNSDCVGGVLRDRDGNPDGLCPTCGGDGSIQKD